MKAFLHRLAAVAAGGLVLWLIHLALDPVPVAAGPAYALGAVFLFIPALDRKPWAINAAALAGAVAGALVHRGWHTSGLSPPPAEGLGQHVFFEGLMGFLAALLALGIAVFVLRRVRAASGDETDRSSP